MLHIAFLHDTVYTYDRASTIHLAYPLSRAYDLPVVHEVSLTTFIPRMVMGIANRSRGLAVLSAIRMALCDVVKHSNRMTLQGNLQPKSTQLLVELYNEHGPKA